MPPRRRNAGVPGPSQAPVPSQAPAPTLSSLPDDLLARCLASLGQSERLAAGLVCNRFHRLSTSPALLQKVDVDISGDSILPKARSLLSWLLAHGKHIRYLNLIAAPSDHSTASKRQELAAIVSACLTACSGAGAALEKLWLGENTPLATAAWLPKMRQLSEATLGDTKFRLHLPEGLRSMPSLAYMLLWGSKVTFCGPLPAGLTELRLKDLQTSELPQQVLSLPKLRWLQLDHCAYSAASMESISRLSSLTRLEIFNASRLGLPASLSALSGLRCLQLHQLPCQEGAAAERLGAALRAMSGLTALALKDCAGEAVLPPVASLPRLQQLALEWEPDGEEPSAVTLPPGPWQQSIRQLCTSARFLVASVDVLRAAPQLEHVCLRDVPHYADAAPFDEQSWDAFWSWASCHTSLCRLSFDLGATPPAFPAVFVDALMRLRDECPSLKAFRYGSVGHPSQFDFTEPDTDDTSND